MIEGIILIAVLAIVAAYFIGKQDSKEELQQVHKELVAERSKLIVVLGELDTTRKVQHNLNCLVGDLRHEVSVLKPDALAYNQSKGLWCTDRIDLIRHHKRKELFFRLGYPEHKL